MAYLAVKPVRFDRSYAIGEIVPDGAVDPKMEKRLLDWGQIVKIAEPSDSGASNETVQKVLDNEQVNGLMGKSEEELTALAEKRGVELDGASNKADILARIICAELEREEAEDDGANDTPPNGDEKPPDNAQGNGQENTQANEENAPEGQETPPESEPRKHESPSTRRDISQAGKSQHKRK